MGRSVREGESDSVWAKSRRRGMDKELVRQRLGGGRGTEGLDLGGRARYGKVERDEKK